MGIAADLAGRYGTVIVRDHFWPTNLGIEMAGVSGSITVVAASDALGFELNNRDSVWLVKIDGERETVILPGCAVLGFHYHDKPLIPPTSYLTVL